MFQYSRRRDPGGERVPLIGAQPRGGHRRVPEHQGRAGADACCEEECGGESGGVYVGGENWEDCKLLRIFFFCKFLKF